jgi:hypothetical protein
VVDDREAGHPLATDLAGRALGAGQELGVPDCVLVRDDGRAPGILSRDAAEQLDQASTATSA